MDETKGKACKKSGWLVVLAVVKKKAEGDKFYLQLMPWWKFMGAYGGTAVNVEKIA